MSADIFSATAELISWLIETPSRSATSASLRCRDSGSLRFKTRSFHTSQLAEEAGRSDRSDTESLDPGEVTDVVSDDGAAVRRDGRFGNHVILRILQERSPQEGNLLPRGDNAHVVDEMADVARAQPRRVGMPKKCVLVLQHEGHRDDDLERAPSLRERESRRMPLVSSGWPRRGPLVSRTMTLASDHSITCSTTHRGPPRKLVRRSVSKSAPNQVDCRGRAGLGWTPAPPKRSTILEPYEREDEQHHRPRKCRVVEFDSRRGHDRVVPWPSCETQAQRRSLPRTPFVPQGVVPRWSMRAGKERRCTDQGEPGILAPSGEPRGVTRQAYRCSWLRSPSIVATNRPGRTGATGREAINARVPRDVPQVARPSRCRSRATISWEACGRWGGPGPTTQRTWRGGSLTCRARRTRGTRTRRCCQACASRSGLAALGADGVAQRVRSQAAQPRTPLTPEQKAASVAKAKSTRAARGTKGARQKEAVKGNVTGVVVKPISTTV